MLPTVPLILSPRLVERPWGGSRLAQTFGARHDPACPFGEAWLAGPDSSVVGGPAVGATLAALATEHGAAFVGTDPYARYGSRMPLLVKLLDAAEPLSVQVHPDDAHALRHEAASGHLGKDEAWLVLDASPGAHVAWGWRRTVTPAEVRTAAALGTVGALLREVSVGPGDVIVNEAGVVHAVGAGILLYEVQQASDLTYRLYDYGRLGLDGRPRALHLDVGLAVARLTPGAAPAPPPVALAPGRERLVATRSFTLERWRVGGDAPPVQRWRVAPRSLEVWTVLAGHAEVESGGERVAVTAPATVALAAAAGDASWRGEATLARATA